MVSTNPRIADKETGVMRLSGLRPYAGTPVSVSCVYGGMAVLYNWTFQ